MLEKKGQNTKLCKANIPASYHQQFQEFYEKYMLARYGRKSENMSYVFNSHICDEANIFW